jgi:hypothetical protein
LPPSLSKRVPKKKKKKEKANETQGKKNKKDDDLNPSPAHVQNKTKPNEKGIHCSEISH